MMQPRFAATIQYEAAALPSRGEAERELARAPYCGCCVSPRVHLAKFVGSTLFLDDKPSSLRSALPFAERARWSERLIGALIVLFGRPRVTLAGRS
jgi:hypothetical protein